MNPQIDIIRTPVDPDSIVSTPAPVRILLIKNRADLTANNIIELPNIPMYYTIDDVLRALWIRMGKTDDYAPANIYLGVPQDDTGPESTFYVSAKTLAYNNTSKQLIGLYNPYKKIIYKDYVNVEGGRIPVQTSDRSHMNLEDVFYADESVPVLHAYVLSGLMIDYGGRGAVDAKTWNGAVYPYWRTEGAARLSQKERDAIVISMSNKEHQRGLIQKAYEKTALLQDAKYRLQATGIKQISYVWAEKPVEFPGVDMLFYNVDANQSRPFMRFYPRNGTVINKLYQPNPLEPPYVNDARLLQSWAAEKSPNNSADVLMMKSEVRTANPPLYGTFRANEDGSADFLMLPPKDVRVLSPQSELVRFYESMHGLLEGTSYKIEDARFYRGTFQYGITLPLTSTKLTALTIANRVKAVGSYFQQIKPLEGDTSLITLRYRAVSNYVTENNIGMFITQYMEKGGDIFSGEAVDRLVETFGITEEGAKEEIKQYQERSTEYGVADHDDKNFVALKNPGIDISIYARHPTYSIHIYRVDSLAHLQRVAFLINLLLVSESGLWYGESVEAEETAEESAEVDAEPEEDYQPNYNIGDLGFLNEAAASIEAAENIPEQVPSPAGPYEPMQAKEISLDKDCKETAEYKLTSAVTESFLLKTLKSTDKELFDFKDKSLYSSRCQKTDNKQPMTLTKEQYEIMLNTYAEDLKTDMAFIVYGTADWEKQVQNAAGKEAYTLLRYGSDPSKLNYFFCSEYFCLKDSILIRPRDFKSNVKRDSVTPKPGINIKTVPKSDWDIGAYKNIGSCPFCCGTLILDEKNPVAGQTVIQRLPKKQGTKVHSEIGFHASKSPAGLSLPCCFVPGDEKKKKKQELAWDNETFAHIKSVETAGQIAVADESAKKPSLLDQGRRLPKYSMLQTEIGRVYVVDEGKYPANPGVVAKCGPALDTYFGQNSAELAVRDKLKQVVNPQAHGFFRVGVYNNINTANRSFFSALAPLLNVDSAEEVVGLFGIGTDNISATILPRVFMNLNFGNLLLEFFKPGDAEPDNATLETFSQLYLGLSIQHYRTELSRIYRSYMRFIRFVKGEFDEKVQYRQFFHILAEKGLLVRRNREDLTDGLNIIVLEYDGNPSDPATRVTVKCPPYGFDMGRYRNNDYAFMSVDKAGLWEPLIYVDAQTAGSAHLLSGLRQSYFRISPLRIAAQFDNPLPKPLIERFNEFNSKCAAGVVYRGIYTAQTGIDAAQLIPLSKIVVELAKTQTPARGIIRDTYNHIVGVTVRDPTSKADIIIPAADDGYISYSANLTEIHLNFDVKDAPHQYRSYADAGAVYRFYTGTQIKPLQIINAGYALRTFKCETRSPKKDETCKNGTLVGFTLSNGIILPCRPTSYNDFKAKYDGTISVEIRALPYKKDVEFEYEINDDIAAMDQGPSQTPTYDESMLVREEIEEIYEHYRLTFSRWLRSEDAGTDFRNALRGLIMESPSISPIEKRRRLAYILGPMLSSWLLPKDGDTEKIQTLVRKDCRMTVDRAACNGHCGWSEERGKCILHVPRSADIGTGTPITDVIDYYVYRLIYEIVSIPVRYREIEEGRVPRITPLRSDVKMRDQWVVPENVPAWHELLYGAKKKTADEKPIFYEEFSDEAAFKKQAEIDEMLIKYFGVDVAANLVLKPIGEPKTADSYYGPARDVLVALEADKGIWSEEVQTDNEPLGTEDLEKLSTALGYYPVVFITDDTEEINYGIRVSNQNKKENVYVIIYKLNDDGYYEAYIAKPYGLLLDYVPLEMLNGSAPYDVIKKAPITGRRLRPAQTMMV